MVEWGKQHHHFRRYDRLGLGVYCFSGAQRGEISHYDRTCGISKLLHCGNPLLGSNTITSPDTTGSVWI
jgi:hypothetical protein